MPNATTNAKASFWQFEPDYWLQQLHSTENGLTQAAAADILRQKQNTHQHQSAFQKDALLLLSQFKSPLMLLLIGAVVLSAFLGDTDDVFIILFIVLSTGLVGFFQERNAGKVVEKLQGLIALKSMVFRDGKPIEIPSAQIVPGDVLLLNAGDMIPADCLVLEANQLQTNEASLTGESYPVHKERGAVAANTELSGRKNCLWEGASILSGTAKALVIATGDNTLFGAIAQSASATLETAFEKGIKQFGFFLMRITLFLSVFILIVNLLNHKGIVDSALFALALAVGMAPELLPAITTIAMSAGARRMLEKKVIVKKLSSIQNLGEVNLLCTDKTGTITEGAINVSDIVDFNGNHDDFTKKLAIWNARLQDGYANPIDEALNKLANTAEALPTKTGEIPYDFTRKLLSIALNTGTEKLLVTKGAFDQVISTCSSVRLANGDIEPIGPHCAAIEAKCGAFGQQGFRSIGVCYKPFEKDQPVKEDEKDMIFAGVILLVDPVKPGIVNTIAELKKLQVDLKIITGDNKTVARSIGEAIGIKQPVVFSGRDLAALSEEQIQLQVKQAHIFAEVEPQQKESIVKALRKSFTVAYIGDGINDVPAINAADVGISVENAVDVAREAADFVLMEKDLMVLTEGIREGRKTFANTLKYIFINTGSTFGNMFSVAAASLLLPFLPMLPKQILLTNFITDFPYLTVASDNVDEEQLAKPGIWDLKLIRRYMVYFGLHSSVFDMITFFVLLYVLKAKESAFQTGWFVESILTELFILFIIRTHKSFIQSKPGKYLFILSALGLALTLGLPYLPFASAVGLTPLPMVNLGAMLLIVIAYILTADLLKIWFFKRQGQ